MLGVYFVELDDVFFKIKIDKSTAGKNFTPK